MIIFLYFMTLGDLFIYFYPTEAASVHDITSVDTINSVRHAVYSDKYQPATFGDEQNAQVDTTFSNEDKGELLLQEKDLALWKRDFELLQSGQKVMQPRSYVHPQVPTVYLTFDDGPSLLTEEVLDILKEEEVSATFFVLGQAVEAHSNIVQRIVEEGHAIGNHTYNHKYEELYQNFTDYWQQVQQTEQILQMVGGITTKLVRTPGGSHGHFDPFYFYFMDQAGYQIYDWNVDSGDAKRLGVTAEEMVENVKNTPLRHEMHVLMHDSQHHEETVKALPEIIAYYKSQGYQFAVLNEEIEPVVHTLGTLRHDRTMDWEQFITIATMIEQHINNKESTDVDADFQSNLDMDIATFLPIHTKNVKQINKRFFIHLPWMTLQLSSEKFKQKNGQLFISLRMVHEMMGGNVFWLHEEKKAVAQIGHHYMEYDPTHFTITIRKLGQKIETVFALSSMYMEDGTLMVSLTDWVEQMDVVINI